MDDFISNLLDSPRDKSNSSFIPTKTTVPGPSTVLTSSSKEPVVFSRSSQVLEEKNPAADPQPGTSQSILKTDMNPMISWLKANDKSVGDSPEGIQAFETYTKTIPKKYMEMSIRDCADTVAKAIGYVVLHTCNDEFRDHCFTKLGASDSRDVERQFKAKLHAIIDAQQKPDSSTVESDEKENETPPANQ